MPRRDVEKFSLARFIRSLVDKDKEAAPFEHECARAVDDQLRAAGHIGGTQGGCLLPADVLAAPLPGARVVDGALMAGDRLVIAQRDLATSSVAAGGAMVATDLLAANFIDLLRNKSLVLAMGATRLPGLVGNVSIPRQNSSAVPTWVGQAGAATESDASFSTVSLTPKTAHGIQDVTRDLLLQGTPAVEAIIRADLLDAMATVIDFAALHGTGTANQPTGLASAAGIGTVAGGVNGAQPTWDHVIDLESAVANSNAQGGFAYLTNTRVRARLKKTQKFAATNGQEVWQNAAAGDDASMFGTLNGYRAGVSNNVRNDLTKGTSTGNCSAIFFGAWPDLIIGEWGTVEILVDPFTQAATRVIRMHVYQTIDVAVRRANSFAAMLDALTP
ncbi:MAG: phage major capsid protein [Burkholderiaceae bacterium]|nr:phage major capsid protein [Burkholderiaceae bacterium]